MTLSWPRFARDPAFLRRLGSRVLATLPQFAILTILARSTSLSEFGAFAAGQGLAAVLIGIVGFGLPTTLLAQLSSERLLRASLLLSSLGLAGAVLVLVGWSTIQQTHLTIILALAMYTSSELLGNVFQSWMFGTMRDQPGDVFLFVRRILPCLAVTVSLVSHLDPFLAIAIGYATTLYPLWTMREHLLQRSTDDMTTLFVRSRHYWISSAFAMLQQLDIVFVSAFLGARPAGAFGAAFRFAAPVHVVTMTWTTIETPRLSRLTGAERTLAERRFVRTGASYMLLVCVLAIPYAYAVPILLGSSFGDYKVVFAVLMVNSAINVLNQFISSILVARQDSRIIGVSSVVSTLVGLTICFFGAMSGSIFVAAFGTVAIQLVLATMLIARYRKGS